MARTESTMVALGTPAPAFALPDAISGHAVGRDDVAAGKHGMLVLFVCPHCPYVKHVEAELGRIGREYAATIGIVAIMPNDLQTFPQDGPGPMREQAQRNGWNFPYLVDETQEVARAYDAACTPDIFLFDRDLRLAYRGQLDGSRPAGREAAGGSEPVTGRDLRAALDAVVRGEAPAAEQRTSLGCNIKWREQA